MTMIMGYRQRVGWPNNDALSYNMKILLNNFIYKKKIVAIEIVWKSQITKKNVAFAAFSR